MAAFGPLRRLSARLRRRISVLPAQARPRPRGGRSLARRASGQARQAKPRRERQTSADLRDELEAERLLRAEDMDALRHEIAELTTQLADARRQSASARGGDGDDTWESRARELEGQVGGLLEALEGERLAPSEGRSSSRTPPLELFEGGTRPPPCEGRMLKVAR